MPVALVQIVDSITLISAILLFSLMVILVILSKTKRPRVNNVLIAWSMAQQLTMAIRPGLNLLGFYSTTLWVAMIVHATAAMLASVPIFFMYIELKVIIRGSLKTRGKSLKSVQAILASLAALETVLFLGFPGLFDWLNFPRNFAFWIPVMVVDFIAIPYFCYLGISLYRRIYRMVEHAKASRRILISVVTCSVLGMFTGVAGILALIIKELDWFLVRACWLAAMLFSQLIFFSLGTCLRRQKVAPTS